MLQRDAGDLGGPRVTVQELWTQIYRWDQAADTSSQKDTKEESKGDTKKRLVNWLHRAVPAAQAPVLAVLASCWIHPREQELNHLLSFEP